MFYKNIMKFFSRNNARVQVLALSALLAISLAACGEGTVDVSEAEYTEKIVVEGYIYPGQKADDIKITRNFALEKDVDISAIVLSGADVSITDEASGKQYKLDYNPDKYSFGYSGNDWIIDYDKTYRLSVTATVDGKVLSTSASTTTPSKPLSAVQGDLGSLKYRPLDAAGNQIKPHIKFVPGEGISFYAFSIEAVNPTVSSFIYDNAYSDNIDSADVIDDFDKYRHEYTWLQNTMEGAEFLNLDVEWHQIWFYGQYKVTIYGGDKNFKDYLLTRDDVQEMDGNFHAPVFHLSGDGIGIFGSAVCDTVRFSVIR